MDTYKNVHELIENASNIFENKFDKKCTYAACAPGRVNLIGEHTDYNDGFVFPMVHREICKISQLSLTIFPQSLLLLPI